VHVSHSVAAWQSEDEEAPQAVGVSRQRASKREVQAGGAQTLLPCQDSAE
jgi:hypothetical protein